MVVMLKWVRGLAYHFIRPLSLSFGIWPMYYYGHGSPSRCNFFGAQTTNAPLCCTHKEESQFGLPETRYPTRVDYPQSRGQERRGIQAPVEA